MACSISTSQHASTPIPAPARPLWITKKRWEMGMKSIRIKKKNSPSLSSQDLDVCSAFLNLVWYCSSLYHSGKRDYGTRNMALEKTLFRPRRWILLITNPIVLKTTFGRRGLLYSLLLAIECSIPRPGRYWWQIGTSKWAPFVSIIKRWRHIPTPVPHYPLPLLEKKRTSRIG